MGDSRDEIIDVGGLDPGFRAEIVAKPGGEWFPRCFFLRHMRRGLPDSKLDDSYPYLG